MIIKIKNNFIKNIGTIYTELYETVGKENADRLILIWLKEMDNLFSRNK
jgi:hypothetical protein